MKTRQLLTGCILAALPLVIVLSQSVASRVEAQAVVKDAPAGSTYEQRLEQRKAEQKITLEDSVLRRIENRCVAIQTEIRKKQQKLQPIYEERTKKYNHIEGKLWSMVGSIKLANGDSFELEKLIGGYQTRLTEIEKTYQSYEQTLDDLTAINCQADVVGFKALLETARHYHGLIRSQSNSVRLYILNEIKSETSKQAGQR